MKNIYYIFIFCVLIIFSCTKVGITLDNNIITPISVIGDFDNMVYDSVNPVKISISSSVRARGIQYTWAYIASDGGYFATNIDTSKTTNKISPNTFSSIRRGDTLSLYYIPKRINFNGLTSKINFYVKNNFNTSRTLIYSININTNKATTNIPIILGPQDNNKKPNIPTPNPNTVFNPNDPNSPNRPFNPNDPNDPNSNWNIMNKRDTVGVGDHMYILGRNFQKFVTTGVSGNTTIYVNGRSIGKDSITVIADTSIQIITPPNLYSYFIDTMKIALKIDIDLSAQGKGVVSADFTNSSFAPVWRPTYFVYPINTNINNPRDIIVDTSANLIYVCSSPMDYNTIDLSNKNSVSSYSFGVNIIAPTSITLDKKDLYIAGYSGNNDIIYKIPKSTSGASANPYLTGLNNPFNIIISNNQNSLLIYNENPSYIYQLSVNNPLSTDVATLQPLYTISEAKNVQAGIALNKRDELFVAFESDNTIRKITNNAHTIIAGNINQSGYSGHGVDASLALLNKPYKILSDNYNSLFFTDNGNNAVRVISAFTNRIYTIAGDPILNASLINITNANNTKATTVSFTNPTSITMDNQNNIYIINNNIYKLELR